MYSQDVETDRVGSARQTIWRDEVTVTRVCERGRLMERYGCEIMTTNDVSIHTSN